MIARLLITPSIDKLRQKITEILLAHLQHSRAGHPDLLYIRAGEKLGIAEAKKVKEHFSLKPYSADGRVAVLEDASALTTEAQNALLKTVEELPEKAVLIMGTASAANLLPTVLSRCEIISLKAETYDAPEHYNKYTPDCDRLLMLSIAQRFEYVEKLKNREEFLHACVRFFRQQMLAGSGPDLAWLKELLLAEKWAKQNVNIRAILEYLMLAMPAGK